MGQYAAGIVLYNPEIDRLKANLDAIHNQVRCVYCFDNASDNLSEIKILLAGYSNVQPIYNIENLGIATALNRIVEQARMDCIEWILTLDQDSVACSNMVIDLASLRNEKDTIIICPVIEDVRRKNEKPLLIHDSVQDIDFCITSGSFMNVEKTLEIGGFDDWLFIGLVDNEICMRAGFEGYRIIRNNAVVLNHELGNLRQSRFEKQYLKLGEILHNEIIKKLSYKREVSPMRLYYGTRNMIYLKKKYGSFINKNTWNRMIIQNSIYSIVRGRDRFSLISAVLKGFKDGKAANVKPYIAGRK